MTRKEYFQLLIDSAVDGTFPGTRIYHSEKDISMRVCALRGENGTKCAAGLLIDDKDYDIRIESGNFINYVNIPEGMTREEIVKCQICHDSAFNFSQIDSTNFSNIFYKNLKEYFPDDIEIVTVENNDIATGQSSPKILANVK